MSRGRASSTGRSRTKTIKSTETAVSAISRGIQILRAFKAGDGPLSNSELARRTNLPRPTISRITGTLAENGCLNYIEAVGGYKLGSVAIAVGRVALANFDFLQLAGPFMQKFANESGLTVGIGGVEKNRITLLGVYQGPALVALQLKVGMRFPLFSTALGRAYLAAMSPSDRTKLLEKYGPADAEDRERDQRAIERAAAELEKRGFCSVTGDWDPDINGVAAPVMTEEGIFVLNCGGPAYVLASDRMIAEIGPQLAAVAKQIKQHR